MRGGIFVCTTCNRYAPPSQGEPTPGQRLAQALVAIEGGRNGPVPVRTVVCLNGCPKPCTAALREPGKFTIRFSHLTAGDARGLLEIAERYAASPDGNVPLDAFPAGLRGKMSGRIPPIGAVLPPDPPHGPGHDPIPALPGFGP
jgi:predicted metal-binding protein